MVVESRLYCNSTIHFPIMPATCYCTRLTLLSFRESTTPLRPRPTGATLKSWPGKIRTPFCKPKSCAHGMEGHALCRHKSNPSPCKCSLWRICNDVGQRKLRIRAANQISVTRTIVKKDRASQFGRAWEDRHLSELIYRSYKVCSCETICRGIISWQRTSTLRHTNSIDCAIAFSLIVASQLE